MGARACIHSFILHRMCSLGGLAATDHVRCSLERAADTAPSFVFSSPPSHQHTLLYPHQYVAATTTSTTALRYAQQDESDIAPLCQASGQEIASMDSHFDSSSWIALEGSAPPSASGAVHTTVYVGHLSLRTERRDVEELVRTFSHLHSRP